MITIPFWLFVVMCIGLGVLILALAALWLLFSAVGEVAEGFIKGLFGGR